MASLTGVLNGTDVLLQMFDPNAGVAGEWSVIGGQVTNEHTVNNAPLDMSNKSGGGFREFVEGEAQQSIDDSVNIIFSTDTAFAALQLASRNKEVRRFIFVKGNLQTGPGSDVFQGMIPSFVDTSPNEQTLTAQITIESANDDIIYETLFNDAIDSAGDDAIDAGGDAAVALA